jgi:hypothetical protein
VVCRTIRVASDRACTRVTARNLHGKAGVSGSSPEEGLKYLEMSRLRCLNRHAVWDQYRGVHATAGLQRFRGSFGRIVRRKGTLREHGTGRLCYAS